MCLLFTRGKPKRISAGVRKLVVSPRREHSRKPDSIIRDIEAPVRRRGPAWEIVREERAPGWAVWGTETDRFADFPLFEEVGARPSATTATPPGAGDQRGVRYSPVNRDIITPPHEEGLLFQRLRLGDQAERED